MLMLTYVFEIQDEVTLELPSAVVCSPVYVHTAALLSSILPKVLLSDLADVTHRRHLVGGDLPTLVRVLFARGNVLPLGQRTRTSFCAQR